MMEIGTGAEKVNGGPKSKVAMSDPYPRRKSKGGKKERKRSDSSTVDTSTQKKIPEGGG